MNFLFDTRESMRTFKGRLGVIRDLFFSVSIPRSNQNWPFGNLKPRFCGMRRGFSLPSLQATYICRAKGTLRSDFKDIRSATLAIGETIGLHGNEDNLPTMRKGLPAKAGANTEPRGYRAYPPATGSKCDDLTSYDFEAVDHSLSCVWANCDLTPASPILIRG